jgi:hypothetical protein
MGKSNDGRSDDSYYRYNHRNNELGAKLRQTLAYSIIVTCVLLIAAMITVFYLYNFHGNPPIEIRNTPFPTDKQLYKSGDTVKIYVDMCRKVDVTHYTSHKRFVNGIVYPVQSEERGGMAEPGCFEGWVATAKVPPDLPTGNYHIDGQTEYQVNPFAVRSVPWQTEEFEVANAH